MSSEHHISKSVILPRPPIVWGTLVGIKSRILKLIGFNGGMNSPERVREYYATTRYDEQSVDIIAASTDWYRDFAMSFALGAFAEQRSYRIIELGCGQGKTVSALESMCIELKGYFGIDLFISEAQHSFSLRNDKIEFLEGRLEELFHHIEQAPEEKTGVLSINALCYLVRLGDLMSDARPLPVRAGDSLILVEPFPSIFWESWFNGISIKLRHPKELSSHFEQCGWELKEVRKLYLFKIGRFYVWPVSYGLHMKSQDTGDVG